MKVGVKIKDIVMDKPTELIPQHQAFVYSCCLPYCNSKYYRLSAGQNQRHHFYTLPINDKERLRKWNAFIGNTESLSTEKVRALRICSDHFETRMFQNSERRRLLRCAVPTLKRYIENTSISMEENVTQATPDIQKDNLDKTISNDTMDKVITNNTLDKIMPNNTLDKIMPNEKNNRITSQEEFLKIITEKMICPDNINNSEGQLIVSNEQIKQKPTSKILKKIAKPKNIKVKKIMGKNPKTPEYKTIMLKSPPDFETNNKKRTVIQTLVREAVAKANMGLVSDQLEITDNNKTTSSEVNTNPENGTEVLNKIGLKLYSENYIVQRNFADQNIKIFCTEKEKIKITCVIDKSLAISLYVCNQLVKKSHNAWIGIPTHITSENVDFANIFNKFQDWKVCSGIIDNNIRDFFKIHEDFLTKYAKFDEIRQSLVSQKCNLLSMQNICTFCMIALKEINTIRKQIMKIC